MNADLKALLEAQADGRNSRLNTKCCLAPWTIYARWGSTTSRHRPSLSRHHNLWAKFETQHELIRAALKKRYLESEYAEADFIDTAECTYVSQRSTLTEYANKLGAESTTAPKTEPNSEHAPKTTLPRIKLQTFSIAYGDWPAFRDLFLSLIGDNSLISDVEKLHYLRSCL